MGFTLAQVRHRLRLAAVHRADVWESETCAACGASARVRYKLLIEGSIEMRRWPAERRCPNHCTHDEVKAAEQARDVDGHTIRP